MRKRSGNPHQESHNDAAMTCFDWFAPIGTDPKTLPALIEAAVPGVILHIPKDAVVPFTVNGFLSTSLRADGSLYVSVCLFGNTFNDNPRVPIGPAPNLNPGQQNQMVNAAGGEHGNSKRKIDGNNKNRDKDNLSDAGFSDADAPMKNT